MRIDEVELRMWKVGMKPAPIFGDDAVNGRKPITRMETCIRVHVISQLLIHQGKFGDQRADGIDAIICSPVAISKAKSTMCWFFSTYRSQVYR